MARIRVSQLSEAYSEQELRPFRLAIYLARFVQNPLREVCALDNDPIHPEDSDLFSLRLHTSQSIVPSSYLRKMFTRTLCQEVVTAGVYFQELFTYPDAYSELSFVPGLGVRKARNLKEMIASMGKHMKNREMMKEMLNLGDEVYKNCNAFMSKENEWMK